MSDYIRWTMSLRKRDTQLAEIFENLDKGDKSAECRRLMYLGLELEAMRANGETLETPETHVSERTRKIRSETPTKVDKKTVLNDRLDKMLG